MDSTHTGEQGSVVPIPTVHLVTSTESYHGHIIQYQEVNREDLEQTIHKRGGGTDSST